ncbi:MAG TPA: hypothetical protein VEJ18_20560, partial [Planctomycetota bacterium]|nr:hypothetical protein [Planctomycetota bacterium]
MKTALRLGSGLALLLLLVVAALWVRRGAPDEAAPSRTAPGSDAAPPPSLAARKTAVDRIPRRPGVHQVVPGDRPSAPDEIVRIPLGPLPDGSVADGTVSALEDTVKRRGGTYVYNSRGYGATFGEEGPDVLFEARAEGLGHPTFAYRLREARLGNRVIAAAGPARAYVDPAERAVAYDRGRLEERYVLNPDS